MDNKLKFKGQLTAIKNERTGSSAKGEWASLDFELTEINPSNVNHPQIGLFSFFKNGEYLDYAKNFKSNNKIGDILEVEFNLKRNTWTKTDGTEGSFYSCSAWKVDKVEEGIGF